MDDIESTNVWIGQCDYLSLLYLPLPHHPCSWWRRYPGCSLMHSLGWPTDIKWTDGWGGSMRKSSRNMQSEMWLKVTWFNKNVTK